MSDKQQFLIYVDFGSYTYKYLFITNIIPEPEWPEDDKRWFTYDERGEAVNRFKQWADTHIGGVNGKVVLVEPCDFVLADSTRRAVSHQHHEKLTKIITDYMAGNPNHFMSVVLSDEGDTSEINNQDFAGDLAKVISRRLGADRE